MGGADGKNWGLWVSDGTIGFGEQRRSGHTASSETKPAHPARPTTEQWGTVLGIGFDDR